MSSAPHEPPETLLPRFGLTAFRPGQQAVIETVLAGRDCLLVMPTGGGKSLCYQLPALMLDGLTLVVSPLIALMKDQVDQLQARGLPVSFINSTLAAAEQYARLDRLAAGEFRLLYVVPERFRSQRFLEAVRAVGVKLLAVDEAHCISEWGHDFRPDYARLGYFRHLLGLPPTIALTATATDRVRRDIVEQLDLRDPQTFITGFARPNLFYEIQFPRSERHKADLLLQFLDETPGAGIIYASTRKKTEEVAEVIGQNTRRRTTVYHAGLLPDQRRAAQEAFMGGQYEIVVATNAFGMGIDKADVRFVLHYNMPGSLEAYYQEAGRAGRDGAASRCLMLYHASDRFVQEFFIESAYPKREIVQAVYEFLCGLDVNPIEMTQQEIKERLSLPIGGEGVGNCEQLLESAGVLERLLASENRAAVRLDGDLPTLVDLLPKQAKVQRRVLQAIERLVGARRQELVYFQPRELTFDDIDTAALNRAIGELNQHDWFTYLPPFRGRAIRMIRRDQPFEKLDIDFAALEQRKAAEYEKLHRVIDFARSSRCRQAEILRYFGERNPTACGHCDNCGTFDAALARRSAAGEAEAARSSLPASAVESDGDTQPPARLHGGPDEPDSYLQQAVQMVLSGVARSQARYPIGKTLVAQMLRGSKDKKVAKLRLDQLSTFGLLGYLKEADVVTLIDALIAVDCLQQVEYDRFRPVVQMTDRGTQVMRGSEPLPARFQIPRELREKLAAHAQRPSAGRRKERAAASDVRDRRCAEPSLPAARKASRIDNVGPPPAAAVADASPAAAVPDEPTVAARPAYYWTWRLLSGGFSLVECTAIRGQPAATILAHAREAAANGWSVQPQWVMPATTVDALDRIMAEGFAGPVTDLLPRLPAGTQLEQVELYLWSLSHKTQR